MAIYHLTAKNGSKTKGHHAAEKQAYIERLGKYADRNDLVYSSSGNLPFFAGTEQRTFWLAVDNHERDNATLYKEIEFSLPRELSVEQQIELATSFAKHITNQHKLPYTFAIHRGIDPETGEVNNPHCHLIFNERGTDQFQRDAFTHFRRHNKKEPAKGGAKKLDLSKKDWLRQIRKDWQDLANDKLEQNHINERIDHRTLKAQGILREPQIHLGKTSSYLLREKNIQNTRVNRYILIDRLNTEIGTLEHELNREIKERQNHRRNRPGDQTSSADLSNSHRRIHDHQSRLENISSGTQEQQPTTRRQLQTDHQEHGSSNNSATHSFGLAHQDQVDAHVTHTIDPLYSSHLHDVMEILSSRHNSSSSSLPSSDTGRWEPVDTDQATPAEIDFKNDITRQKIYKQLRAMKSDRFTITIQTLETKTQKDWSFNEVLEHTHWLKKENAKGADIFISLPQHQSTNLILLKDLNKEHIEKLNTSGYEPCVVIQTAAHQNQYEAWINVSSEGIEKEVAILIRNTLIEILGNNTSTQETLNGGRLAGFTNREKKHQNQQGQSPFVKLSIANQKLATNGEKIVTAAKNQIDQGKLQEEKRERLKEILEASGSKYETSYDYKIKAKQWIEQNTGDIDLKELDQEVIKSMALTGKYSEKVLIQTLEQCSPNIPSKENKHIQAYAEQTVGDVMTLPEVLKAKELQKQQDKVRSHSRGMRL